VPCRDDEEEAEQLNAELLRKLAENRGLNRTPPEVLEQARDALSARQKESRLLELVYDSLIDSEITVDTSEGPVRLLEFSGADSTVEVALAPVGDRCDLVAGATHRGFDLHKCTRRRSCWPPWSTPRVASSPPASRTGR